MKRNQSVADVARDTLFYAEARVNAIPLRSDAEPVEGAAVIDAEHSMQGYGTLNGDQHQQHHRQHHGGEDVHQMADAAYRRRFMSVAEKDDAARPLVGNTGAPDDVKP